MKQIIHDMLTGNRVYFCKNPNDVSSSCIETMMRCFEIFNYHESGWLFYRLYDNCVDLGYVDMDECLIGPCPDYDRMVCVAKLLDTNGNRVDIIESPTWVEEEDYNKHKNGNTIKEFILELSAIEYNNDLSESDNNSNDDDNNNNINSDNDDSSLSSCGNNCTNLSGDEEGENFKHGYSSSDSEESE